MIELRQFLGLEAFTLVDLFCALKVQSEVLRHALVLKISF